MAENLQFLKEAYALGTKNNFQLTQSMLQRLGWPAERIGTVLNTLVQTRVCFPRKNAAGQLVCRVREQDVATRLKQLSAEDYQVFCSIEDAGNSGIWTADIRRATNLQQHIIQKAVKNLCDVKRLIKQVKSIQHKSRKLYMLANLEPAAEIAGGCFYTNGEFDTVLVEQLRENMLLVLSSGKQSNFADICKFVRTAGLGRDLSDDDLRLVLRTLELEQKIQQTINPAGEATYVVCRWPSDFSHIEEVPCSSCPVFERCTRGAGGRISPEDCLYISHWLSYDFDPAVRTTEEPPSDRAVQDGKAGS